MKRLWILVLAVPLAGCVGFDDYGYGGYGYGGDVYQDYGHPITMPTSSCGCASTPASASYAAPRVSPMAPTAEPPH